MVFPLSEAELGQCEKEFGIRRTQSSSPPRRRRVASAPLPNGDDLLQLRIATGNREQPRQPAAPPATDNTDSAPEKAKLSIQSYFGRWKGVPNKKRINVGLVLVPHWTELAVALLGASLGIGVLSAMQQFLFADTDYSSLIGSFGATAVLLYGAPASPLAQPRNVVGGHIVSALAGVAVRKVLVDEICAHNGADCTWLGSALAVAFAICFMLITQTVHPPGGATALIAVIGNRVLLDLGFLYVVLPVALGACIMVLVCLIVNNFDPYRSYPQYWW